MPARTGRVVGLLTALGLFVSTTALGFPTASATAEPATAPDVPTGGVFETTAVADAEGQSGLPAGPATPQTPSTTVADPGPAEILAHHSTTTVPGDVIRAIVEESDGLWASGIQLAAAVPAEALPIIAEPTSSEECYQRAGAMPLAGDHAANLIAQMTHFVFECVTAVEGGLDEVDPTSGRRWDGARVWGFQTLAEQVAAEAVTVAYCESLGFSPSALRRSNPWGYAGLFQVGAGEFRRFSGSATSRFDPVDNAYASARYFTHQHRTRAGWGGWSPWAVVNTNFAGVNDQVKIPILPRFVSTEPGFRGRQGPELPAWAVDPWTYRVPDWNGCPYAGGSWPAADRL